uniref:hypothetical protein n=1 Tax=Cellvibrio fontiphilus TaxID=1815559 RepID=UPI002B4C0ADD|nr:hypothetical protein [Cellvibrio fontiphilus]
MTDNHVLEIAIFKAKPGADIDQLRKQLQETLRSFSGLLGFYGYRPLDNNQYADLVKWDSLHNAKKAAAAFEAGDPRLLPYLEAIEEVVFMGHFQTNISA